MYSTLSESNGSTWFQQPDDQIHNQVLAHVSFLNNIQSYRNAENVKNMRLYGNFDILGIDAYNYMRVESSFNLTHRVTLNIVQSMVDTVVSKITKNKPKPTFLTDGGDWDLQQRAKKLNKYCEGIFYSTHLYRESTMAFLDACIFGTGAVKIFKHDNEIKAERVLVDELKIDDSESFYGKPRTLHQVKFIHKDVLKGMFPGNDSYIEESSTFETEYSINKYYKNKQMVYVIESWHLPSTKDGNDGKHTICIANRTLFAGGYDKSYFPFIFHRWTERPIGFFGQGITEQLTGLQLEINKILKTIQISMHLCAVPKLLVEASSKIVTAHLNNKIGGIIKYAGTPPQYAPLGGVPPELFSHLDRLYQRAYEIIGISSLSAQSSKPAGLNSGKALREFNDIESERFMAVGMRYEQTFLDASNIILDLAKDIYKDTGEFAVKVKGQSFVETIDWSDVDMEEDKYMMSVFPTSALSSTPSARLQDVTDLLQAGFISKEDGMKLLDFPDLKSTTNLYNAAVEDIERTIDKMINTGEYMPPETYQNLELGVQKIQQAYLLFRGQNAPEETLELLRRWVEDANGLLDRAKQELAAQQAMEAAPALPAQQPLAAPVAPPQSDILPLPTATPPAVA